MISKIVHILFLQVIFLLFFELTFAQQTGFTDSFNDSIRASVENPFSLTQSNGILNISVNKPQSIKWQGVEYSIGEAIDISENPFINIKLKSDDPLLLTIYIEDEYFANSTKEIRIYPSDYFVNYFIDFSGSTSANKSRITKLRFVPNGNSISEFQTHMYFDEISAGTDAVKYAGIGAIKSFNAFINSTSNKLNILDIKNTEKLTVSGAESALKNIIISQISNGIATLTFDCVKDFKGEEVLSVTAVGKNGYVNNTIDLPIFIEDNLPPEIDSVDNKIVTVGDTNNIILTGINDGNKTIEQQLVIKAFSNNQSALPDSNLRITYDNNLPVAKLTYVVTQQASDMEITITVDDQYSENNLSTTNFFVDSYTSLNNPPTIAAIKDQFFYQSDTVKTLLLDGITDGDTATQEIIFSVTSSNENVIPNGGLNVKYVQGNSFANLEFIPKLVGTSSITITLEDNGGTEFNNGNTKTKIRFNIEVGSLPQTGHVADFTSFDNWGLDYHNGEQDYELGSFKGKQNVLKITLNNKVCWTGTIYNTPELNLDKHRYVSYEIYFEGEDFGNYIGGRTHCYFYDDGWDPDIDRNLPAAHAERKAVVEGKWKTVFMDFRSKGGMDNVNGEEINVKRIQKVLLNYATKFTWPFPTDNGTVYIANLRIGAAVPDSLIPSITPICTINPIANQTVFKGDEKQTIKLSGITNGSDDISNLPVITVASSDTNFIKTPEVTTVKEDGTALLTYLPAASTGSVVITLKVSADNSLGTTSNFKIDVVNKTLSDAADVEIFKDTSYQTIRGFGTFYFQDKPNYVNFYTDELGASAVRLGIISNQIEPENDNDDPNILNLDAFNFNAFDFEYLKELKNKGVETFILTSWSPPAWMKKNLSVDYGFASAPNYKQTDNKLEPYYFEEFAESMVAVVKMFQIKAGINLYAIGIQNEPAFNEPYASAILDPTAFAELVKIVGKRFEQENISTKLYMPEQVFSQGHYSMSEYIDVLKGKPEAEKYVDIIATHSYDTDGIKPGQPDYSGWKTLWNATNSTQHPKELWMSETYPESNSWDDALSLAGAIHGALKYGNVSLWTLWDIEGSLLNVGTKLNSFYTSKNYYKFIRPGSKRIKVNTNNQDILVTSFLDEKNKLLTTVMINKSSKPITARVLARTSPIPAKYDVYTSAKYLNFENTGTIGVNETLALPGKSVTTLVGKTDGEMVVGVNNKEQLPTEYILYNNYPNPFNPTTTIKYSLKKSSDVKLFIYDILGREIKRLVNKVQSAGTYNVIFNAANYASGVYFYRLQTGNFTITKKLILLK